MPYCVTFKTKCIKPNCIILIVFVMHMPIQNCLAQAFPGLFPGNPDSFGISINPSGKLQPDSLLQREWKKISSLKIPSTDSIGKMILSKFSPSIPSLKERPFLQTGGGQLQYGFIFNNHIDSPYTENNVYQHQLQLSMQFNIARTVPITVYATVRRTNSEFFRDIYELRADLDLDAMKRNATTQWLEQLGKKNSATAVQEATGYLNHYKKMLSSTGQWLQQESWKQKFRDYLGIVNDPSIIRDSLLKDPALLQKQEETIAKAKKFVAYYQHADSLFRHYRNKADSIEQRIQQYRQTAEHYRLLLNRVTSGSLNAGELEAFAAQHGLSRNELAGKMSGLLSHNRLSLGRSIATPSALITNNTRINGVHFEHYNRFYYAVDAGLVDFAIRDYISVKQKKLPKEYMASVKLGVGRPQQNHLFISWFTGRKRDFSGPRNTDGSVRTSPISGVGTGGRLNIINQSSYITWEAAHALKSLPLNSDPANTQIKAGLLGRASKSIASGLRINLPRTSTVVEGWYKYFGAGYQSFANSRITGNQNQWGVKASQKLFKKRLKMEGSVKTYEFNNQYNFADINAQTVVKSFSLSWKQRKMPSVYIGYMPLSQVVKNGSIFRENTYQVLNATVSHQYKIGIRKTVAALAVTKFMNKPADTAYSFYNSTSVYYQQQIYFLMYTGNFGVNYNRNGLVQWTILEGGATAPFGRRCSFSLNGKVISINNREVKTGWNGSAFIRVFNSDYIQAAYQRNFIPVSSNRFTTAGFFSLQFYKTFK